LAFEVVHVTETTRYIPILLPSIRHDDHFSTLVIDTEKMCVVSLGWTTLSSTYQHLTCLLTKHP